MKKANDVIALILVLMMVMIVPINKSSAIITSEEIKKVFEKIKESENKIKIDDYYYLCFDESLKPNERIMKYKRGFEIAPEIKEYLLEMSRRKQDGLTRIGRSLYKHGDLKLNSHRIDGFYANEYKVMKKDSGPTGIKTDQINTCGENILRKLLLDDNSLWCATTITDDDGVGQINILEVWSREMLSEDPKVRQCGAYAARFYVENNAMANKDAGNLRGLLEYVDQEKCEFQKELMYQKSKSKKLMRQAKIDCAKAKEMEFNEALLNEKIKKEIAIQQKMCEKQTLKIEEEIQRNKQMFVNNALKKIKQEQDRKERENCQKREKIERQKKLIAMREANAIKIKEEGIKVIEELISQNAIAIKDSPQEDIDQEKIELARKREMEFIEKKKASDKISELLKELSCNKKISSEELKDCYMKVYGESNKRLEKFIQIVEWRNLHFEISLSISEKNKELRSIQKKYEGIEEFLYSIDPLIFALEIQNEELLLQKESELIDFIDIKLIELEENYFNESIRSQLLGARQYEENNIIKEKDLLKHNTCMLKTLLQRDTPYTENDELIRRLLESKTVDAKRIYIARKIIKKYKEEIETEVSCEEVKPCESIEMSKVFSLLKLDVLDEEIKKIESTLGSICRDKEVKDFIIDAIKSKKHDEKVMKILDQIETLDLKDKEKAKSQIKKYIKDKKVPLINNIIDLCIDLVEKKTEMTKWTEQCDKVQIDLANMSKICMCEALKKNV